MSEAIKEPIQSLRFEEVSYSYPGHETFNHANFDFPVNQVVWVEAASGSGRTTLMQLMAGLIMPSTGRYLINEKDVADMSFEEFLPYRLSIGYGFDHGGLLHNRTMHENLMLPLLYHKILGYKKADARVSEYLDLFGMMKFKDSRPAAVSSGTRKLICLIRSLILHPKILLLDEPTVGLNQETALKYFDLVHRLRDEGFLQSIFISTFDEKIMSVLEHRKIFIHEGKLLNQNFESVRGVAV